MFKDATSPTNVPARLNDLLVQYRSPSALGPYERNPRTHSKRQIRQIKRSIESFGFVNPVLIDANDRIIAGHGRVEAATLLGMEEIPTICVEGLSADQIRAYIIADNKLAANAGWDNAILAIELQHLITLDCPDLDVAITGFEVAEIDAILEEAKGSTVPEDLVPELESEATTQFGDLWLLGKHKIICGNALNDRTYKSLMSGRRVAMVFSDPPYNVKIDGHASGNGSNHHREFAMASGEMSEAEFVSFLTNAIELAARFSAADAIGYFCIDWRHIGDLLRAAMQSYDEFANLCVWAKDNAGMGSFYRSQHELVAVFRKGKGPHRNNVQLGKFGRHRTNLWWYPCAQTLSKQGDEGNLLAIHPTVKPVAMVADAILDCTARGEVVLDGFLGSGTTLMAAERVGRICFGIEIDPLYVDVAIRRWQNYTGEPAILASTGKRFNEVSAPKEDAHG